MRIYDDDEDRRWIIDSVSDARSSIEYSEATGGPVDLPHPRYHGDRMGYSERRGYRCRNVKGEPPQKGRKIRVGFEFDFEEGIDKTARSVVELTVMLTVVEAITGTKFWGGGASLVSGRRIVAVAIYPI